MTRDADDDPRSASDGASRRYTDEEAMALALDEAERAWQRGDGPVGAVILDRDRRLVGVGANRAMTDGDPTAHAEMDAIRAACAKGQHARLRDGVLVASMEPCPMCAWAMRLAGIGSLVLGARHADLGRTDLGRYEVSAFAGYTGWPLRLTTGVAHADCVAMRSRPQKGR